MKQLESVAAWKDLTVIAAGANCIVGLGKDGTAVVCWSDESSSHT